MQNALVVLVVLLTTCLSSLFSPASGVPKFSFGGWPGSEDESPFIVEPGNVIQWPLATVFLAMACLTDEHGECLPDNFLQESSNEDVAAFSAQFSTESTELRINSPGTTILRWSRKGQLPRQYLLIVTPSPSGTLCPLLESQSVGVPDQVVDCSGKCVDIAGVNHRLRDTHCDDETQSINLSCESFLPAFNSAVTFFDDQSGGAFMGTEIWKTLQELSEQGKITQPDAGACTLEDTCEAQFGDAPGYMFCNELTGNRGDFDLPLCSFTAITGTHTRDGTCTTICQRFGSRCLGALDDTPRSQALDTDPSGCTPNPDSRDTCDTPRQTEICICERQ
jgi:hypothetical protein